MKTLIFTLLMSITAKTIAAPTHKPKYKCSNEDGNISYLIMGLKFKNSNLDWSRDVQLATSQQFLGCLGSGTAPEFKIISRSGENSFTTNTSKAFNSQVSLNLNEELVLQVTDEINEEFEELKCTPVEKIDSDSKCD